MYDKKGPCSDVDKPVTMQYTARAGVVALFCTRPSTFPLLTFNSNEAVSLQVAAVQARPRVPARAPLPRAMLSTACGGRARSPA